VSRHRSSFEIRINPFDGRSGMDFSEGMGMHHHSEAGITGGLERIFRKAAGGNRLSPGS
jgi:hypothetical protein